LRERASATGLTAAEVEDLRVAEVFRTGALTTVRFQQMIGEVPVYRGYIRVTLDERGHVAAFGADDIIPGARVAAPPQLTARQALEAAYRALELPAPPELILVSGPRQGAVYFANPRGAGLLPIPIELQALPSPGGGARLAYRMTVEVSGRERYDMLVGAAHGEVLLRHSLARGVAQARVWKKSPLEGARSVVAFPQGWLPENFERTTGNNADAYLDTNGDNQPDAATGQGIQEGRAFAQGANFDFAAPAQTGTADPRNFPAASLTNLFYFVNLAHDYFYALGFDEAAGNFQRDNLGKGGAGNDHVLAEAFDPSFTGEGFVSAPEGMSPRLQVGFGPGLIVEGDGGSNPNLDDVDISYDGSVIVHEYAHGVIDRLVGGPEEPSCLAGGLQSAALAEGWADYFAISFFDDPVLGGYAAQDAVRGLRRQSYAGSTLTYGDFGSDGLINPRNEGEIWASALWELRSRIGAAALDALVLQGMRLTPCDATFVDARDAILMADQANGSRYQSTIWSAFASRGLGFSAGGQDGLRTLFAGVVFTAASDLPPRAQDSNRIPAVTSELPENSILAPVGTEWRHVIRAQDPDGDILRFELVEAPAGMTIDFQTGSIRWNASGFTGARVVVAITDGKGGRTTHGFYVRTVTRMTADQPLSVSGGQAEVGFGVFELTARPELMQVTLREGSGDADLFLVSPIGSPAGSSSRAGTNETLSRSSPAQGTWFIGAVGAEGYAQARLQVSFPTPREVTINAPLTIPGASIGSESFFVATVPADTERLAISTRGSDGNADLFLMRNQPATCQIDPRVSVTCVFEESSRGSGSSEILEVFRPVAGRWYFSVSAAVAYSTLDIFVTTASPQTVRIVTGDGQSGLAGGSLPIPPTVEVLGAEGTPLRGLAVEFAVNSGAATVSPAVVPTGVDGRASASVRLGSAPGAVVLTATVAGLPPLNFQLNVLPFQPAQISPNGVVLATLTPFVTTVSPGAIISIFGDRFTEGGGGASAPRIGADGRVSTELAGVCVEIAGQRAPMLSVSRNQINAQVPAVASGGQASVAVLKGCDGGNVVTSQSVSVPVEAATPAFFNFFNSLSGNDPVAALHQDGVSYVGPRATVMGAEFTPARPGEAVAIYGAGFGPTSPALAPGDVPSQALPESGGVARLTLPVEVTIGGVTLSPDQVLYVGSAPCCAGLYQLNVIVPNGVPDGNLPIRIRIGNTLSPLGPFLSVAKP
jgi:uncharacterized protein (TIGR03437 family)